MSALDPSQFYGRDAAAGYEHLRGDEPDAVAFLAETADSRPALEFAIGTGRIALPLQRAGVEVHGLEMSPHMISELRQRKGGEQIPVVEGDMARTEVPGRFGLVYLVYNTIFNLVTQYDQVACFENAARHLQPGGAFVVETAVPSAWTDEPAYVRPEWIAPQAVGLDVVRYDAATQIFEENHIRLDAGGIHFGPTIHRLAWPAELDLMAQLAGLDLEQRWGGWRRERFTAQSRMHVSVYRRPHRG